MKETIGTTAAQSSAKQRYHGNGCASPPNCYQVSSWVICSVLVVFSYWLIFPNLPELHKAIFLGLYSICLVLLAASYILCTFIDPSDPGVKHFQNPRKYPLHLTLELYPKLCLLCQARVQENSKHCKACNRCTLQFDHHCVWVNNCVARRNYVWFMVLTCSVEAVVCVQTYCSGQLIARILSEEVTGSSLMVKYDIGERGYCYFVTIVCVLVISLIVAVSNGFLLLFHLFLRIRRLTTYDYLQSLAHNNKIHPLKYTKTTGATTLNDSISQASRSMREKSRHPSSRVTPYPGPIEEMSRESSSIYQARDSELPAEASRDNVSNISENDHYTLSMEETKEALVKKVNRLETEKQQLVQLLHETEETMSQQFKKSQEETAHLKQLFTSVLPLIKARSTAKEQGVNTIQALCSSKGVQIATAETQADPRIAMQIAALEQKLSEIELCALDSKANSEVIEELNRLKQREAALQETASNCKKLAEQLQSENDRYTSELQTLQKENEMLRLYVLDSEGQDRPVPAVCKALYSVNTHI